MTRVRQPTAKVATTAVLACLVAVSLLAIGVRPATAASSSVIVDSTPAVTSASSTTFVSGFPSTFTVTTTGHPAPSLQETGALPTGITWTDDGDGTATLAGTPDTATSDTGYPITLRATDGTVTVTQSFLLTVAPAPVSGGSIPPVGTPTPATDTAGPTPVAAGGDRLAAAADGQGYWIVGTSGSVTAYGTAVVYGSMRSHHLNAPIVGVAATPDGKGYWLVASDGGVFTFGDAGFFGSTGNTTLNQPVMGMAVDRTGHGYWLVASDGGVFTFGDAGFFGSGGSAGRSAVGLIASPRSPGYALIDSDGTRNDFGW